MIKPHFCENLLHSSKNRILRISWIHFFMLKQNNDLSINILIQCSTVRTIRLTTGSHVRYTHGQANQILQRICEEESTSFQDHSSEPISRRDIINNRLRVINYI